MNCRDALRLVMPLEGAVGKVNLDSYVWPEKRRGLALRYRVGGDESAARRRALDEVARLLVPAADEVEVLVLRKEREHVCLLLRAHPRKAQERRVAHDVVKGRLCVLCVLCG